MVGLPANSNATQVEPVLRNVLPASANEAVTVTLFSSVLHNAGDCSQRGSGSKHGVSTVEVKAYRTARDPSPEMRCGADDQCRRASFEDQRIWISACVLCLLNRDMRYERVQQISGQQRPEFRYDS